MSSSSSQWAIRKLRVDKEVDTILCDIEGTTTSISFVKDVLFSYVRDNLSAYLTENYEDESTKEDIHLLIEQNKEDLKTRPDDQVPEIGGKSKQEMINSIVKNVNWQMDMDRKAKPLKQLEGHMWRRACETGSIKGHMYDDVIPAFERWILSGRKIYIYSSGSIEAQKLIFGYSDFGNLLKFISGHFDTTIGTKDKKESYETILAELGKSGRQVLFLTDMIKEADAAEKAGVRVGLLRRSDNPDKEVKHYEWVTSFDEIEFASST